MCFLFSTLLLSSIHIHLVAAGDWNLCKQLWALSGVQDFAGLTVAQKYSVYLFSSEYDIKIALDGFTERDVSKKARLARSCPTLSKLERCCTGVTSVRKYFYP